MSSGILIFNFLVSPWKYKNSRLIYLQLVLLILNDNAPYVSCKDSIPPALVCSAATSPSFAPDIKWHVCFCQRKPSESDSRFVWFACGASQPATTNRLNVDPHGLLLLYLSKQPSGIIRKGSQDGLSACRISGSSCIRLSKKQRYGTNIHIDPKHVPCLS